MRAIRTPIRSRSSGVNARSRDIAHPANVERTMNDRAFVLHLTDRAYPFTVLVTRTAPTRTPSPSADFPEPKPQRIRRTGCGTSEEADGSTRKTQRVPTGDLLMRAALKWLVVCAVCCPAAARADAVDDLIKELKNTDSDLRRAAAKKLGEMG